jgi:hypothetical protein
LLPCHGRLLCGLPRCRISWAGIEMRLQNCHGPDPGSNENRRNFCRNRRYSSVSAAARPEAAWKRILYIPWRLSQPIRTLPRRRTSLKNLGEQVPNRSARAGLLRKTGGSRGTCWSLPRPRPRSFLSCFRQRVHSLGQTECNLEARANERQAAGTLHRNELN